MHRILKNAGYVPEEVALRREITSLAALIDSTEGPERTRAVARRDWLRARRRLRHMAVTRARASPGWPLAASEPLHRAQDP